MATVSAGRLPEGPAPAPSPVGTGLGSVLGSAGATGSVEAVAPSDGAALAGSAVDGVSEPPSVGVVAGAVTHRDGLIGAAHAATPVRIAATHTSAPIDRPRIADLLPPCASRVDAGDRAAAP